MVSIARSLQLVVLSVLALLMSGCSTAAASRPVPEAASLPDLGAAPELSSDTWLNTEAPLRLASLRGQVVLIEMWTFGCINCQRVIPHLQAWHEE
jgi:thiol-disulfide isomerase/thioredoxin